MRLLLLIFCLLFVNLSYSNDLVNYVRDVTVLVESDKSEATGLIINRGTNSYILTVAHAVKYNIEVKRGVIKGGRMETKIKTIPLKIHKTIFDSKDNIIEITQVKANIIKYSPEFDIALLKINKANYSTNSVSFCLDDNFRVGDKIYFCANFDGSTCSYSFVEGIISYRNRTISKPQIQISAPVYLGGSGSPIFLPNKQIIGILNMKRADFIGLCVRMEEIKEFAESYDCLGILYPDQPIDEKLQIE